MLQLMSPDVPGLKAPHDSFQFQGHPLPSLLFHPHCTLTARLVLRHSCVQGLNYTLGILRNQDQVLALKIEG